MAPPLMDDGVDGGRHKNSRKIKRLRDVSCMRKRETRQDKWGRQRGGRKARWDKLDRHPSALKSGRLRAGAGGSSTHAIHLDETFLDGLIPAERASNGHVLTGDVNSETIDGDADHSPVLNIPNRAGIRADETLLVNTPSSNNGQDSVQNRGAEGTLTDVVHHGRESNAATTPTPNGTAAANTLTSARGLGSKPQGQQALSGGGRGREQRAGGLGSGGVRGNSRRSALRSSPGSFTGIGGLSRTASGFHLDNGRLVGKFRGSPPPLRRRLSAPASADRRGGSAGGSKGAKCGVGRKQKGQSNRQGRGAIGGEKQRRDASASLWQEEDVVGEGGADDIDSRTPPLPPSLFDSVFKNKLPSLTPRKAVPVTPRLSKDSIVHAIFQSLFGKRRVRSGPRERYGGDWDDVHDEDENVAEEDEEVDESWIKTGISLSLFNSQAVDFACRSTAGADLMHEYVDSNAVFRLVTDLRFEDPRVPSPRLMIIKAIYENCAHLRLPTLRALAHASHDHLMRTRELEAWAAKAGVDMAEATAAAVADGSKLSVRPAARVAAVGVPTARAPVGGVGPAIGAEKSVRVTGRDQSQTLGELLLFALQTFSKYFLGMVDGPEGSETAPAGEPDGRLAADPTTTAAVAESLSSPKDWNNKEIGFDGPPALAEGFPIEVDVPLADAGRGQWRSMESNLGTSAAEPVTTNVVSSGACSDCDGSSIVACGGVSEGSSTDDTNPTSGCATRTQIDCVDPCGTVAGGVSRNNRAGEHDMCASATSDERQENIAPKVEEVASPRTIGDEPEGQHAFNSTSTNRVGQAATISVDDDTNGRSWPMLNESPENRKGFSDSSRKHCPPAPSTPPTPVRKGGGNELLASPAGTETTGLRELEDNVRARPGVWSERGGGHGRDFDTSGGGVGDSGDAWGRPTIGDVGAHFAWHLGSPSLVGRGVREGEVTKRGDAGPARTLRFTEGDDGDQQSFGDENTRSSADGGEGGKTNDKVNPGDDGIFGIDDRPMESANGAAPDGLAFDQWASSMAPPAMPLHGSFAQDADQAPAQTVSCPVAPSQAPDAGEAEGEMGAAAATVAAREGKSAEGFGASGLPAVALKEAARSLCNLYASHGAPAAGGGAAAAADVPERLQPLAAAGSALCQIWPPASTFLLRRLLGTWPVGSSKREVAYLRLIAGVACAAPPVEVMCPGSRIPLMLFRRLAKCINSPNTKVAQEAVYLVQADFMVMGYLAPNRRLMDLVTKALYANRDHWTADVRNTSDQAFDLMLDFL